MAIAAVVLALAACAGLQRAPSPADLAAKRFESVPGKGVVYIFRNQPDFIDSGGTIQVDGRVVGTTYPGTYLRLVLEPGVHRLTGFAGDSGILDFAVHPGGMLFIEQQMIRFIGPERSTFRPVPEGYGRDSVLRAEML